MDCLRCKTILILNKGNNCSFCGAGYLSSDVCINPETIKKMEDGTMTAEIGYWVLRVHATNHIKNEDYN
jgi:hypothetical protein